jgi:hypothetical protein
MNKGNGDDGGNLRSEYERYSALAERIALLILVGLAVEIAAVFILHKPRLEGALTIAATALIAIGVWGEILLEKRAKAAGDSLVAQANERAAKADLARAELEDKLRPRMLNQAQWDFIQALAGRFEHVNIGYETDAETWWYASDVQKAFFAAGIRVGLYPRAADVHSFGTLIYEPRGFEGARPRTVEPLVEIFRRGDLPPVNIALAVITSLPTDLAAPPKIPMIILGGRFLVNPARGPDPRIAKHDANPK